MKELRRSAWRSLLLAVGFCVFFEKSKHLASVARVNPFAEDPVDAVGSFGVQLAMFLALLSMVRAYRTYGEGCPSAAQVARMLRGRLLGDLTICLTLLGDLVLLIRHAEVWRGAREGRWLAAVTAGFLLLTAVAVERGWRAAGATVRPGVRGGALDLHAGAWSVVGTMMALAVYPDAIRHSLRGALLTVVAGVLMLFVPLWALVPKVPQGEGRSEDALDDLLAVWLWVRSLVPLLRSVCAVLERWPRRLGVGELERWLNPRRSRWRLPLLTGCGVGFGLVGAELASGETGSLRRMLLLVSVYVGLESVGVLTGYALPARPLGCSGGRVPEGGTGLRERLLGRVTSWYAAVVVPRDHVPGAEARGLRSFDVRAKARTYLRDECPVGCSG